MSPISAGPRRGRHTARSAILSHLQAFLISAAVTFLPLCAVLSAPVSNSARGWPQSQSQTAEKLGKPKQLDKGVRWQRDPATGELKMLRTAEPGERESAGDVPELPRVLKGTRTQLVLIQCSVFGPDGAPLRGLTANQFRVYDEESERPVEFFAAGAKEPARVALVIDASPSVLPETEEMKRAADALVDGLAPSDQVAVVDFSAHTYQQTGFTGARDVLRKAVDRVDVRQLLGDTGGSNIYEAVYLTAHELFEKEHGRKAIVLLTDGQDSGLGLTFNPASAVPRRGGMDDRLTFDDVARELAAKGIQVFVVSTETRPKILTLDWFAAHRDTTFLTQDARRSGIPAYTLYLAEIVRRSAGDLYFLHESGTLATAFGQIAERVGSEYMLGVPPEPGGAGTAEPDAPRPGWHRLRVETVGAGQTTVIHRTAYFAAPNQ
jgi:VWFA-related protein